MKANDTEIRIFLEGGKQFIVPLFQRTYSWKRKNIQRLWDDILETKKDYKSTHFFGSFVSMPMDSAASKVSRYLIIDGQQRHCDRLHHPCARGAFQHRSDHLTDKSGDTRATANANQTYSARPKSVAESE